MEQSTDQALQPNSVDGVAKTPKFFVDEEVDRIDVAENYWVDIKHEMSIADFERMEQNLIQFEAKGGAGGNRATRRALQRGPNGQLDKESEQLLKANFHPSYVLLLEINIVRWNLPGADSQIQTLNRESISRLTKGMADLLAEAIDERNPTSRV